MERSTSVLLYINGNRRVISGKAVLESLLTFLRRTERLTGAKLGCGEGGCGACTVLLSSYAESTGKILHRAVNACLLPVAACDGCAITTIEAVGDRQGGLAPIQAALVNSHGSQCGFCTPGIVMSMFALLRQRAVEGTTADLSDADVESNFDGNLCRCTGYRPILDAFKGVVRHGNNDCAPVCVLGKSCCRADPKNGCAEVTEPREDSNMSIQESPSVVDREHIFPPELIKYRPIELNLEEGRWLRPVNLERFLKLKAQYPSAKIIVGNTELGIEAKFKGLKVSTFLSGSHVPELLSLRQTDEGVEIGSSVTWTQLNSFIDSIVENRTRYPKDELFKFSSLQAVQSQLRWFAGTQIRNVAAIGGNIVTASPISDVNPIWVAAASRFIVVDVTNGKQREVNARDFFVSYRRVNMSPNEILLKVIVPWNESPYDITHAFKVSRRREDDIAIVSAGIRICLREEVAQTTDPSELQSEQLHFRISFACVSFGGLAPTTISLPAVEECCMGKLFNETTLREVLRVAADSTKLPKDVPGGMPEYRQNLAIGFLFKAFASTSQFVTHICNGVSRPTSGVLSILSEGTVSDNKAGHGVSRGVQISGEKEPESVPDHTGQSIKHLAAVLQVSGEAKYLDDIAPFYGELQAALVLSTEPHAKIMGIDEEEASQMPGVQKIVSLRDLKGENLFGPNTVDELCFAKDIVTTVGQVIAVVAADTLEEAKNAARSIRVSYEKLPAIITIEEAIEKESFAPGVPPHLIRSGDTAEAFRLAQELGNIAEGTVRIGAQEHWYLEPQGTIAIPDENGEMVVIASTQAPAKTQEVVAKVLGQPMHKVLCKVKRLGGGFGGKESRSLFISAAAAVTAQATGRPVRLILDRDIDMLISGTRHAFLAKYKVGYQQNGRITTLELRTFLNMGNNADLSIPVLDRSLFHGLNCYNIPNVDLVGRACFTHTASATAFRGFGGPQGMMIAENVIERVAWETKIPPQKIRDINMFGKHRNEQMTHFGMPFNAKPLISCWDSVLSDSCFEERKKIVSAFNKEYKLRKRGISAIPTMFGIGFTFRTYNQAGALVHIFHGDGSVLISHGGVEMGQGLHTKVCQVAATELGLALNRVFISETATDKVPNASPTAASSSSDLYGMAVKNACIELLEKMKPSRIELGPGATWEEVVNHAYFNRVSLSATGFYKTPELDQVNLACPDSKGTPFFYFTNGAAVTEVEIDLLTGESTILRTDIVMDVGRPLNPAVDVGQIEGAFIQGLGWCTMEEVVRGSDNVHAWVKSGQMYTLGPSTYKIPGFSDIPKDFRVRVLETRNEKDTIHSSKAIGEPPLFLAASAFFAIRDAVGASRMDCGRSDWFELDSPASVERIQLASLHPVLEDAIPYTESRAQLSL